MVWSPFFTSPNYNEVSQLFSPLKIKNWCTVFFSRLLKLKLWLIEFLLHNDQSYCHWLVVFLQSSRAHSVLLGCVTTFHRKYKYIPTVAPPIHCSASWHPFDQDESAQGKLVSLYCTSTFAVGWNNLVSYSKAT